MNEYTVFFIDQLVKSDSGHIFKANSHFLAAAAFIESNVQAIKPHVEYKVYVIGPDKIPYRYVLTPKYTLNWEHHFEKVS